MTHENLDVYRAALRFLELSQAIAKRIPAKQSYIADQLRRAALSCVLNIAEGFGKTTSTDQRRFFSIARGSITECAAVVDVVKVLALIDEQEHRAAKELTVRIAQMLAKMRGVTKGE